MTSFRYLYAVMFPWMVTLEVFVCMNTLERVLLCLFSPYLMFFIITYVRTYRSAWTVLYMETVSFFR